jgi:hypothetical protein
LDLKHQLFCDELPGGVVVLFWQASAALAEMARRIVSPHRAARHSRNRSLTPVFARVWASTVSTISAQ